MTSIACSSKTRIQHRVRSIQSILCRVVLSIQETLHDDICSRLQSILGRVFLCIQKTLMIFVVDYSLSSCVPLHSKDFNDICSRLTSCGPLHSKDFNDICSRLTSCGPLHSKDFNDICSRLTSCGPLHSKDFDDLCSRLQFILRRVFLCIRKTLIIFVVDLHRVFLCIQKTLMIFVVDYSLSYVVCSFAFKRLY